MNLGINNNYFDYNLIFSGKFLFSSGTYATAPGSVATIQSAHFNVEQQCFTFWYNFFVSKTILEKRLSIILCDIYITKVKYLISMTSMQFLMQGDEGGILQMTIYKQWLDVFKEPVWTMRDFSDGIVWDKGQVSVFQSGHSEYTVISKNNITRIMSYLIQVYRYT